VARNKKLPLLENIEIVDIAAEGNSMAKMDDMIIFVPGLIPGDIADVQITRKRQNYMTGFARVLKKESDLRLKPFCHHFGVCGGCRWQHLPYEKQLHYKQKQVSDNLQHIGKVKLPEMNPIIGSKNQQYYRNKLEFTFSDNRWLSDAEVSSSSEITDRKALGFHIPGKFDRVLDIDECFLQDKKTNQIRNEIRHFTLKENYSYYHQRENTGLMRNLIIRNTLLNEWMVIVVFQYNDKAKIELLMNHIHKKFPSITSLLYVINPKLNDTILDLDIQLYAGCDHIFEELDGLRFKIGPKSFFQTNSSQSLRLYQTALQFAELKGDEVVYDLYTGTGTIANFVARYCRKVIGIETVEEAISDAKMNALLNHIDNAFFFAGDMKEILNANFIHEQGRPDVIITDPPRGGMHNTVIQTLLDTLPERIVYISCNPATQARDIQILSDKYRVTKIQPVDMFPHTYHVENVAQLGLKYTCS
jgi:23S rRNA (uracil1939-C5)-methyltransferase